jgi:prepilin-type N-terminal cleavage/methylation domain-containing protein
MKRRAFTLMELLVVVAVAGILIAIAMPTLSRARFVARRALCLNRARELSRSHFLYVYEQNEFVWYKTWKVTEPTLQLPASVWAVPLARYGNIDKVRQCPEAVGGEVAVPVGSDNSPWNQHYRDEETERDVKVSGGYAINGWLFDAYRDALPENTPLQPSDAAASRMRWVWNTVSVPAFVDGLWSEAFPLPSDQTRFDLKVGPTDVKNQMSRVNIARHRKTVNVAYFDMHAENIPLRDLWTLLWKPNWKAPDPLPMR